MSRCTYEFRFSTWIRTYGWCWVVLLMICVDIAASELHVVVTSLGNVTGSIHEVSFHDDTDTYVTHKFVQYLGIPYAEPPTGTRRFTKPVAKEAWSESHNGTFYRPACHHGNQHTAGAFEIKNVAMSEDCLTLNIYAPFATASGGASLPVLVYLHSTPSTSRAFVGDVLSVYGDLVVVVINFRQDVLGFLSTGDSAARGNYGLWDQQLAIAWVNEHISGFGGNSALITLVGHSTGASDAILQTLYTGNEGNIKNVVAMSGTPIPTYVTSSFLRDPLGDEFAGDIRCDRYNSAETVACIRRKSVAEINEALRTSATILNFRPVIDGDFIKANPQEILDDPNNEYVAEAAGFNDVNMLLGLNSKEGGAHIAIMWAGLLNKEVETFELNRTEFNDIVVPTAMEIVFGENISSSVIDTVRFQYSDLTDLSDTSKVRTRVVDFSTDIDIAAALVKTANFHSKSSSQTFLYQFSEQVDMNSTLTPSWLEGANRGDDVYFLFGFSQRSLDVLVHGADFVPTANQRAVSRKFMEAIATFAKLGSPVAQNSLPTLLPHWEPYQPTNMPYMDISHDDTSLKRHFRQPFMTFWTKLVPSILHDIAAGQESLNERSEELGHLFKINMLTAENIILALSIVSTCLLCACVLICSLAVAREGVKKEYDVKPTVNANPF